MPIIAPPAGKLTVAGRYFAVAFRNPGKGALGWTGYAPTVVVAGTVVTPPRLIALAVGRVTLSSRAGGVAFTGTATGRLGVVGLAPAALVGLPPPVVETLTIAMDAGRLLLTRYPFGLAYRGPGTGDLVAIGYAPTVAVRGSGMDLGVIRAAAIRIKADADVILAELNKGS